MATAVATSASTAPGTARTVAARSPRVVSVDALRGFVMFTMIFVNDLAGAPEKIVPAWMKHFHGKSGMTFVDLVFPAFLFLTGMSIPFALGGRMAKGEARWKILGHVIVRTLSLLLIGVMMVNETPNSEKMGWSGALWCTLMYLSAMLAFCAISPGGAHGSDAPYPAKGAKGKPLIFRLISLVLRLAGFASLFWLALAFRGEDGHAILSLDPFSIHVEWYGILGLIGWAYLMAALALLVFGPKRTALLGCVALLMCLYPADKTGAFNDFWLSRYVGIGGMLGSHAAIAAAGVLLAAMLISPDKGTVSARTRFTGWFILGFAGAAWLTQGLYGINKNAATPSWCFWACAITAALWLVFHFLCDVQSGGWVARPLAIAGPNVLLAYLISEMLPGALAVLHLDGWYDGLAGPNLFNAVARSAGCGLVILCVTAGLNRVGFRLKL